MDLSELYKLLQGFNQPKPKPPPKEKRVISDPTLDLVCDAILKGKCKNIIVMSGAGISVAAGLPDFKSPGTGLYHNLEKYNLPYPEAVFTLSFFQDNPKPFFTLAKELYPGKFRPTAGHYFIRLLHEKDLLLRNYTQNIDTLERVAGIPPEVLVEAHGSFGSAQCLSCSFPHSDIEIKDKIFNDEIPKCKKCKEGVVKPNIVFYGENLPERFSEKKKVDFPKCDLLIVIGTSLTVSPFCTLVDLVGPDVPRVLINREKVGSFDFDPEFNFRDVPALGLCDDIIYQMVQKLGWSKEFEELLVSEYEALLSKPEFVATQKELDLPTTPTKKNSSSTTVTSTTTNTTENTSTSTSSTNTTEKATTSTAEEKTQAIEESTTENKPKNENVEAKVEIQAKVETKFEEKAEIKFEEKAEAKVEEKSEAKVEEKVEEKAEEKAEEKVEDPNVSEPKSQEIAESESVVKADEK